MLAASAGHKSVGTVNRVTGRLYFDAVAGFASEGDDVETFVLAVRCAEACLLYTRRTQQFSHPSDAYGVRGGW